MTQKNALEGARFHFYGCESRLGESILESHLTGQLVLSPFLPLRKGQLSRLSISGFTMNCRIAFALMAVASSLASNNVAAQVDQFSDPLGLPRATLLCHNLPISIGDTSIKYATGLRFEGTSEPLYFRVIDTKYDSLGAPVYLSVVANRDSSGRPVTDVLFARFGGGSVAGLRVRTPSASDTDAQNRMNSGIPARAQILEPLSAAETSKAITLARWLRDHRCPPTRDRPSKSR